jgi:hypothetical protein
MLFYLSVGTAQDRASFSDWSHDRDHTPPPDVTARLSPALVRLDHVLAGGCFDTAGRAGQARRLVGWSDSEHWILSNAKRGRKPRIGSA